MDLLKHIKGERAQKRTKQPFGRPLFGRINTLVKEYALGESFLKRLDESTHQGVKQALESDRVREKVPFEPPLFSLSTEEEYRVTMAILDKVHNPYLHFVNSPDEILLSEALYSRNPSIGRDQLATCHFQTLLQSELAKEDMGDSKMPELNQDMMHG